MALAQLINQNSYLIAALFVFAMALLIVAARFRYAPLAWGALGALAVILVAASFIFRVGVSEIEIATQFDQVLASHQPVMLEIYSNY